MKLADAVRAGQIHHIRTCLNAMSAEELERGLNAFDDGASNWERCFFAQALPDLALHLRGNPEEAIRGHLGLQSVVPVRLTYSTFDGGTWVSRDALRSFVEEIRFADVDKAIAALDEQHVDLTGAEEKSLPLVTCA